MILERLLRLWFYLFDRLILYPLLSWVIPKFGITFLNLGYWPINYEEDRKIIDVVRENAENEDEDRAHYYLYEKPLSLHPKYPVFNNLHLLEVACGQGSGLEWIAKTHPFLGEIVGLDRIPSAKRNIIAGRAESLPFPDGSFDIVLNVEASHLFKDCTAFFKECYRILKPGGYLCWTDLRYAHQVEDLRTLVESCNFEEISFVETTDNVLLGIERTAAKYDKMLVKAPFIVKLFSSSLRATYCAPGTHTYGRFVRREKQYFAAMWRRNE